MIGLSRHAHEAVGTSDETLEEILSLRSGLKSLGTARVLLHGVLNCFKEFHRYKGFMLALIELISVPDLAGEEWVVEDASDGGRGEHPGLCDKPSLSIRQPLGVPGAESPSSLSQDARVASVVVPDAQLLKRCITAGPSV